MTERAKLALFQTAHLRFGGSLLSVQNDAATSTAQFPKLHPWFAIRTKPNHEKVAASVLNCKGLETYLPTYRTRRRWSDRIVHSELPLFPGYVLCRFDPMNRLPVMQTPGVFAIVGFGNEPAPIPDTEITAVQTILRSGLAAEPFPFLREGQTIRVRYGALEGLEGILIKKKTEWRMVVSVTLLQRSISVEIDGDAITSL